MPQPARTLRDAFNAVDPARPLEAGDPRYVDCTDVRGNEDVVATLFNAVTRSDHALHQLCTGHRGSGKSTELRRLKDRLEKDGFAVIYFEADDELDLNDLKYSDLLLARVHRLKAVQNDADHQTMLYNLSVLEYTNGQPAWHDVHPVVLRLPKFKEAWERESSGARPRRKSTRKS